MVKIIFFFLFLALLIFFLSLFPFRLAWFIIYAIFVTFLTGVSVILLFSLRVFQHTNYWPVFILVLLYSLSVILIGFMITPFFDNSRVSIKLIFLLSPPFCIENTCLDLELLVSSLFFLVSWSLPKSRPKPLFGHKSVKFWAKVQFRELRRHFLS